MPGRILLIETDAFTQTSLRSHLLASFYEVTTVSNPASGFAAAQHTQPDIVLIGQPPNPITAHEILQKISDLPLFRNTPVVVLSSGPLGAAARLELLHAGAEDVIDQTAEMDLLMARLRALMRHSVDSADIRQTGYEAQQLALAEAPRCFDPTGQVVLAGASAQQTSHWAEQLRRHLPALIHPTTVQAALSGMRAGNAPDVFAITCGTDHRDPGIQLISELRSRRESHHAALIAVITPPEAIRCARRDRAAMALDIGAADVMVAGFEPQELALRMIRQLAHKKQADFRRQTLRNGLEMAITDPLTGLYNRRYALPQLARISTAAWAQNTPFATMVLDIDRFKSINDNFGHAAGDQVLMNIAARLKKNLRANDLLARIGGEEFLIAMPGSGENAAGEAAERLRDVIRLHPVCLPDVTQKISLTCSIGVFVTDPRRIPAPKPPAPPPVAELIQEADKALYLSKSKGRDMVSFARPAA